VRGNSNKTILILSIPLVILIAGVSCMGLFTPGFYAGETPGWQIQALGQDLVDLTLVSPALLVLAVLAYLNNKPATLLWGGVLLYLFYTFVIYCFDVHFNRLFIFYCIILGLLFYSLIYFLYLQIKYPAAGPFKSTSIWKSTGIYFLVISIMFYILWLSEIVPAMLYNTMPRGLVEAGLPTNPVHVIDLSVILPGIFITGILVLKKKYPGYVLAPVLLAFFILMDITIGILNIMMNQKRPDANLSIAFVMGFLALISMLLLYFILNQEKSIVMLNSKI
jgi:hypothetical protein